VSEHVDAGIHRDRRAFRVRRMREHRNAAAVCFSHCGLRDRDRHRFHHAAAHDRAGEQLHRIGATIDVCVHRGDRFFGRYGLLQQLQQVRRQIAQIDRNPVRRVERFAGGENARSGKFTRFDPLTQRERVVEPGAGVEHRREAVSREHRDELSRKRIDRQLRDACPFGSHEVHVTVVQACHHGETATVEFGRAGRHAAADRRNRAVADDHTGVAQRRRLRVDVHGCAAQHERIGMRGSGCTDQNQRQRSGDRTHRDVPFSESFADELAAIGR
jgi:hypothetical protein